MREFQMWARWVDALSDANERLLATSANAFYVEKREPLT